MRRIVQFSGGGGSWGAAKRVVATHGTTDVTLLFADTLIEDADCYRFLVEGGCNVLSVPVPAGLLAFIAAIPSYEEVAFCGRHLAERKRLLHEAAAWTMREVPAFVWIAEGRTPHEVFSDRGFLSNSRVDHCSETLKRKLIKSWLAAHCDRLETVCYVGIDWTERHRLDRIAAHWQKGGWRYEGPLCDAPYLSPRDVRDWMRAEGLTPPRLYGLGLHHNNCGGGCVKAGQGHWATVHRQLPDIFALWERKEAELRSALGANVSMLSDRTGDGRKKPLTLTVLRERLEGGGQVDMFDVGGCGCALDDTEELT